MSPAVIARVVAGPHAVFPKRTLADRLPGSFVTDYITVTSAYRHMYWVVPPSQLHATVAAHVRLGVSLIASVPQPARGPMAGAISESSLLAGRIEFFDLQSPQQAQESLVTALQAAQDAHDSLMGRRSWRTWRSSPPSPVIPGGQARRATGSARPASSPSRVSIPRNARLA